MKRSLNLIFFTTLFLATATFAHAATLSIDPPLGHFGPGDTFLLTVRLDTLPDECVNAASVELNYPIDWMKAGAVSKGESLLTLWPDEPVIDLANGVVRFGGGIPAGYCGRVQGDPGKTNVIAKIVFTILGSTPSGKVTTKPESLTVSFGAGTKVYQNDGFGTLAPLTLVPGTYVRDLTSKGLKNEWLDAVGDDVTPPELFNVQLVHDPNTFQGKYFIIFSTVDKQSGVDHYEVSEDDPEKFGFVRGKEYEKAIFAVAKSPYVLKDQSLRSRVIVRAFDNAGKFAEAILPPQNALADALALPKNEKVKHMWWYILGGSLLFIILLFAFVRHRLDRGDAPTHDPVDQ